MARDEETTFVVETIDSKTGKSLFRVGVGFDRNTVPYKDRMKLSVAVRRFRNELASITGQPNTFYLDCYESVSLWQFILRRPLTIQRDEFTAESTNLEKLLQTRSTSPVEYFEDLGILFDHEDQVLVLHVPEIWDKILSGIEDQSFVKSIIRRFKTVYPKPSYLRSTEDIRGFLKKLLEHLSFGRDAQKLCDELNRKSFESNLPYRLDKSNLVGVEFPWIQFAIQCTDILGIDKPNPLSLRITDIAAPLGVGHQSKRSTMFPPENKIEHARKLLDKKSESYGMMVIDGKELRHHRIVTHLVLDIVKYLGTTGRSGRRPRIMSDEECGARFRQARDLFVNGDLRESDWEKVDKLVSELEKHLKSHFTSPTFEYWLQWRDKGDPVIRNMNRPTTAYQRVRRDYKWPKSYWEENPENYAEVRSTKRRSTRDHGREIQAEGDSADFLRGIAEGVGNPGGESLGSKDEGHIRDAGWDSETGEAES